MHSHPDGAPHKACRELPLTGFAVFGTLQVVKAWRVALMSLCGYTLILRT
jgi:hypothetical protein